MASFLRKVEQCVFRWVRRDPPQGKLARIEFWFILLYFVFFPARALPGAGGEFFRFLSSVFFFGLVVFSAPLIMRWIFTRFLWKVRNRLIVTYLLMGLAPIVLFVTLAGIATYLISGQFAIFAARSEINTELAQMAAETRVFATHMSHQMQSVPAAATVSLPELPTALKDGQQDGLVVAAFRDGKRLAIAQGTVISNADIVLPPWVKNGEYWGIVSDEGKLYLRALSSYQEGGHTTVAISSLAVSNASLDRVAHGLGKVEIMPYGEFGEGEDGSLNTSEGSGKTEQKGRYRRGPKIVGGVNPPKEHFYDILVFFPAPLDALDWKTGAERHPGIIVDSRPSALYRRLFISSLRLGTIVQDALIGIAVFFSILELFAFIMAIRLNRTITRSIHDLYQATSEIDSGNLSHRIPVRRNDQLAALSGSFNRMSASLARLLEEQREKERLQNELAIAQEVQANLFPSANISLASLELHGVCRPARTVSGDYYDFLLFSDTRLGLALGDISGKGISAALLMATLHSAVRAYRLLGEELDHPTVSAPPTPLLRVAGGSFGPDDTGWFAEPGRILGMLNRHLYRSTQPEKYATLFLGHYDGDTRQLTYSNGGQLPPLVLHGDGGITRLDCGGTVVGLLDNMTYDQETVTLKVGDILVAYSDGVTEPENEFGEFGEERLMEIVHRNRHQPLHVICDQVMQALRNWIGGQEQPDDITLVLARPR